MRFFTKDPSDKVPTSRPANIRNDASPITCVSAWQEAQQTLGNQGMQQLLRTHAIQAKLQVAQPNDSQEQEADRVADQLMRTEAPLPSGGLRSRRPAQVEEAAGSGGRPLDNESRRFFEPRLGIDLSHVRIHTDSEAGQSARAINAKAYTFRNNIVFGSGEYRPGPGSGRRLLAHELAHVKQLTGPSSTESRNTVYRQPAGDADRDLAVVNYEIAMLRRVPVLPPPMMMRLVQLETRRNELIGRGAGKAVVAGSTPQSRLLKAKGLLNKTERGRKALSWLAGYRQSPSALSASLEASEIKIELQKDVESFYDSVSRKIVLNERQTAEEMALSLVDLMNRTVIEPDPLKVDREEYSRLSMYSVSEGVMDRIKLKRELQAQGVAFTAPVSLEAEYAAAYDVTYAKELPLDVGRDWRDISPDAKYKAEIAAQQAVSQAIKSNKAITGGTQQQYVETFGKAWDQARAEQAQRDKEYAERSRIKAEQRARIDKTISTLVEIVNKVDPNSREADQVIQLIAVVLPTFSIPDQLTFLSRAEVGMDRLLGPFGFRIVTGTDIVALQNARLDYAFANYAALDPKQRAELRRDPFAPMRHGIQVGPTDAERYAEDQIVAYRVLPDGSLHVGPLWEFRQAEEQNQINHALEQIDAIANAGPGALVGRIFGGEKGAAIGAMADTGLMILAPVKARRANRAQMSTIGSGSRRPPTPLPPAIRAPAPARTPMPTPDLPEPAPRQTPRRAYVNERFHDVTSQPKVDVRRGGSPPDAATRQKPIPARDAAARDQQRREEIAEEFNRSQKGARREPGLRRDDPKWSERAAKIEDNAQYGRMNEAYLRTALGRKLATVYDNVADQVRVRPNLATGKPAKFYFIADHLARTRQTSGDVAIDGKLSASATLTPNQQAGYRLLSQYGGTVESRNAGNYPYGTVLPPTPAFRAEPTVNLKTTPRPQGTDIDFNITPIP